MNKLKFITGILLILISFTFTSCEDEPIDGTLNPNDFGNCDTPTAFVASDFAGNAVTLSWEPGGDETSWTVEYGIEGFAHGSGTTVVSSNPTCIITGLNSNNSYDFYVQANCSETSVSNWVGPETVDAIQVNPNCPNPGGLSAVRDSGVNTNVNLIWIAGGTETQWEIQFGPTGFTLGSGTVVTSNNTTATVTGVSTSSSFDFYVRSKCSASENSGWVGPTNVLAVGGSSGVQGVYKLTAFNTSVPTDLNGDGTPHPNQMDEVTCFNNTLLTINANNTYTANQRGVDLDLSGGYECFVDPDDSGTWILNGNQITFTSSDITVPPYTFTVSGNTLSATVPDGTVLTETNNVVVELTCDITFIYTKQ
jgi:hypothetical protein